LNFTEQPRQLPNTGLTEPCSVACPSVAWLNLCKPKGKPQDSPGQAKHEPRPGSISHGNITSPEWAAHGARCPRNRAPAPGPPGPNSSSASVKTWCLRNSPTHCSDSARPRFLMPSSHFNTKSSSGHQPSSLDGYGIFNFLAIRSNPCSFLNLSMSIPRVGTSPRPDGGLRWCLRIHSTGSA